MGVFFKCIVHSLSALSVLNVSNFPFLATRAGFLIALSRFGYYFCFVSQEFCIIILVIVFFSVFIVVICHKKCIGTYYEICW